MTRDTKPLITERVKYEIAQNRNSTKYNQAHTTRPYGGAIGKTEIPQGSVPVCLFPKLTDLLTNRAYICDRATNTRESIFVNFEEERPEGGYLEENRQIK